METDKLQYGVKLWSINTDLYKELIKVCNEGKADYLEILYVPGKTEKIDLLAENKIPIVIHAPTFNQGVLFASDDIEKNNEMMKNIMDFSEKLNASCIIVHPDIGNKENFIRFLERNKDKPLAIENMPKKALDKNDCIGYSEEDIKEFLDAGKFKFCLDFSHAIKTAVSLQIDYKEFLSKLIKLNPEIAHLSDGRLDNEKDEHMSLGEGEFDWVFIAKLIKNSSVKKITFEVPKTEGLQNDIKNIEYFKNIMNSI